MKKFLAFISLLLFATVFFGSITIENPVFENQHIKVASIVQSDSKAITIGIRNKTDKVVKILWDETLFTDNAGEPSGVIHSGVKYANMDRIQVPSVIPPNGTLNDIIVPKSHIFYSDGWNTISISKTPSERYFLISYEINNKKYFLDGTLLLKYIENNTENDTESSTKSIPTWRIILGVVAIVSYIVLLYYAL